MKILNFGSLNLDYVYSVDHIVAPGETISSRSLELFPGGKGLNQSVALKKAGADVYHAGMLGSDGGILLDTCNQAGINTDFIKTVETRTGNAIIQLSAKGQNSIILYPGANRQNTKDNVDRVLSNFNAGDCLLLQNEINLIDYLIDRAHKKGMMIALNPSPFDEMLKECDLTKVDIFLLNEIEGFQISGETEPEAILKRMQELFPNSKIVLTLGRNGVRYKDGTSEYRNGIYKVPVVDTTAAGDTFTGFFLAGIALNKPVKETLYIASVASSIAVSRKGASTSIPTLQEVLEAKLEPES